jgi:hypothetical protein
MKWSVQDLLLPGARQFWGSIWEGSLFIQRRLSALSGRWESNPDPVAAMLLKLEAIPKTAVQNRPQSTDWNEKTAADQLEWFLM